VTAPYEVPAHPELVLRTDRAGVDEAVERVMEALRAAGVTAGPGAGDAAPPPTPD
jgi:adenylylsulfate kinase-like enzyme